MKSDDRTIALPIRWLAGPGIATAMLAMGFAYFSANPYSVIVVLTTALGTAALGLWAGSRLRAATTTKPGADQDDPQRSAVALPQVIGEKRVVDALQQELDIHRRLERELTEAKQAAESAMMAKGEFLATMSHEIRTPLNGIIPMLDLLMGSTLPADQRDILNTAYVSAQQMLRIVDDILDYSKLEANKLQLESTAFNLAELIGSVMQLMEKSAEGKDLRLSRHLDPSVRLAVRGDPVRLRQVLTNLLSNAIKFTERGQVSLHVTRKGETPTQHELRFEIRDTGIGIAKENMPNLFRAFSQADASTTRLYGGTGLGLVICKRIVNLMGGNIGVESTLGRGAVFWFEIPLLKAAGDIQGPRAGPSEGPVLLLSHDPALRQRLRQAVSAWGARMIEAETTQETLSHLRSALARGGSWTFDLLIVDLPSVRNTAIALHRNLQRMPELAALRVVYLHSDEPVPSELAAGRRALLLSRTIGGTELRMAISGMGETLSPIATEESAQSILGTTASSSSGLLGTPHLRGRALLVEDNPVNQLVAQRLVGLLGLSCETADNGQMALEKMIHHRYDVVLMDCQMPVKDGYTATTEWRQHEASHHLERVPIIAMTANAMAGDRQKCLEAGMDDYLAKPVDRHLLEVTLVRWLPPPTPEGESALFASTEPAVAANAPAPVPVITPAPLPPPAMIASTKPSVPAPVTTPTPRPTITPTPAIAPALPVLDSDVVSELRSVMGQDYLVLIKLFLEDAPKHIESLKVAATMADAAAMVAPAHTLKSSSANVGAMALSALAKRIELAARTGKLAQPRMAVQALETEFEKARGQLRGLLVG